MKRTLTLLAIFACLAVAQAAHVNPGTAKLVGRSYLKQNLRSTPLGNSTDLQLVYTSWDATQSGTYFYVFNTVGVPGFIIVSGDDVAIPILGYSYEQSFNGTELPDNVANWLDFYKSQIQTAVQTNAAPTEATAAKWEALLQNQPSSTPTRAGVDPLCTTNWNQNPYYNALCPYDFAQSAPAVVGCVATAMAQVMKYWNYPASGTGSHSYYENNYGWLNADFGATNYQWSSMPNAIYGPNDAVALLSYHCGVAIEMDYGVDVSLAYMGSWNGSQQACAENALKNYFGYSHSIQQQHRGDYSSYEWGNLLKSDLNAGRPIIYSGQGTGIGHCFVCDGYDNFDYFHYNWGWGGAYNGYFAIDALDPAGVGTGGGSGVYNDWQNVLVGIQPGTVVGPQPDQYEVNNEPGQAYTLPTNFWSNTINVNTTGSTCHTSTDVDYYKLALPGGYNYSIDARLHDYYDSDNGSTYTLDARFSYYQGSAWSSMFDTYAASTIEVNGGGDIYFYVEPFYTGDLGSYLLDMTLTRWGGTGTAVDNVANPSFQIFPNPAHDVLNVNLGQSSVSTNRVQIVNALGQLMFEQKIDGTQSTLQLPVDQLATGCYNVRILTDAGIVNKSFTVQR